MVGEAGVSADEDGGEAGVSSDNGRDAGVKLEMEGDC